MAKASHTHLVCTYEYRTIYYYVRCHIYTNVLVDKLFFIYIVKYAFIYMYTHICLDKYAGYLHKQNRKQNCADIHLRGISKARKQH
jgi:hypothetical protein